MADTKASENTNPKSTRPEGTKIRWDDLQMKSSYANVCNVSNTREEVVLLFGMNQAWNRNAAEVTIQLTDRIILNPYVAKSLAAVLANVMREYEAHYGPLANDGQAAARPASTPAPAETGAAPPAPAKAR